MPTSLEVHKVLTDDGVAVQVAWMPPSTPHAPVLLLTHGVGSDFADSGLWVVCQHLASYGWGIAFLNNRGHDWVAMTSTSTALKLSQPRFALPTASISRLFSSPANWRSLNCPFPWTAGWSKKLDLLI